MNTIIDIFKTTIFKTKIENLNHTKYFLDLLKIEKKNNQGKKVSNIGGFQSKNYSVIDNKDILQDIFFNPAKEFIEKLNPKKELKITLGGFWINSNLNNDYNLLHNHFGSAISGVYYLKVPKNSGCLVFQNGDLSKLSSNNFNYFDNENYYCRYHIEPKKFDLYLFTSETFHYVEPNRSSEDRISVAFNLHIL
jgi:uncharacterized protein (TIGR02466 family)